jgi:ketosteroid isomerase-like protein
MRHNADYLAGWDDYEVTVEELIDGGDDVVLVMHERTRMRGSEAILERDLPSVLTVRDGRCVRYRVFKTRAQALEAAGLPE